MNNSALVPGLENGASVGGDETHSGESVDPGVSHEMPESARLLMSEIDSDNRKLQDLRHDLDVIETLIAEDKLIGFGEIKVKIIATIDDLSLSNERKKEHIESMLEENSRLFSQSVTDELTGLLRSRKFFEKLLVRKSQGESERREEPENNSPGAFVFVDLNEMKAMNERYGYEGVNQILRQFTRLTQQLGLRANDLAFRYGGDEFVLFLEGANPLVGGAMVAKKIKEYIDAHPFRIAGRTEPITDITFCLGAIEFPDLSGYKQIDAETADEQDVNDEVSGIISQTITHAGEATKATKATMESGHNQIRLGLVVNGETKVYDYERMEEILRRLSQRENKEAVV